VSDAERRVVKMFGALTAVERALLILQAWKEGREEDAAVRLTLPYEQGREFDHLIFLMNEVNCSLGTYISFLYEKAAQLDLFFGWLHSLTILALSHSDRLDDVLQLAKDPAAFSRKQLKELEAAREEVRQIVGYSGVREMLLSSLSDGMQRGWRDVRSVELVVEEAVKEFEGEDPLLPQVRKVLDGARKKIEDVRSSLRPYLGKFELIEPDEAEVEHVRLILKRAERLYA
jgi:exonuclease VII small subunit